VQQSQVKPHSYFDEPFGQCFKRNKPRSCQSIYLSTEIQTEVFTGGAMDWGAEAAV